jgi:hypothetical protein
MSITGRTLGKYCKAQIEDAGGAMRDIFFDSINGVGITYDEVDVSALQDAIKRSFVGQGQIKLTLTGPISNKADATASATTERPAESGAITIFSDLVGSNTPRSFAVYYGMQTDWAAGDPVFGAIDCALVSSFVCDAEKYSVTIVQAANAENTMTWGTAAIAASS